MPLELLRFEMLLPAFGLVLARVGGLVFAIPMLTSQQVPRIVKVWLVAALALMVFPVVVPHVPRSFTLGQAATGLVGELLVGEVLGLGAGLVFLAVEIAGKVVSHQSGMALGEVFNPVMNAPSTVLDQVWFYGVLMFFLAMGGHLAVVNVLLGSFEQVPPMMMVFDGTLGEFVVGILRSTFEMALRLCGPVVLALLLTSLIMGFLTKTMPQLNILSVGFSFKIVTAWFILAITISFSDGMIADGVAEGLDQIRLLFEAISEQVIHAG
ncbi:MAG: flagellar biosynthetic protein FliR [Phycisphaerae bacterium]|nr:flagellar biosynthetic protein FliR [Phycisphaerae bacterium]